MSYRADVEAQGIYDYDASPPHWAYVMALGMLVWSIAYVWIQ